MKSIFNNPVVRTIREEVNDLRKKNKDTKTDQDTPPQPSAPPSYYHHPPTGPATGDSYSHLANSTAGFPQSSAYPSLTNYNQEREKPSLLGRIEATATNLLGNIVGEDVAVSATHKLNSAVTSGRNARELLQSGAIVQLVSKTSSRFLQVVMSSSGSLVFDGDGAPNAFNTYFTIEEGEKGRLRFHNSCNYLAFESKQPCIISLPPGPKNNPSIDFRVHDVLGSNELISLESCACKNSFIAITSDGHLKTMHIKDKNIDTQFSVISVTNHHQPAYPYQAQPYQPYNTNVYGGFPPNATSAYGAPHAPMHHQPPPPAYNAPPPSYSTQNPYSQPPASSGLYPQFN